MKAWARSGIAKGAGVAGLLLAGCSGGASSSSSAGRAGAEPAGQTTASATPPMVVVVDSNRTMTAKPGDGVGVFTEYVSGGHWHVWWTCDTNKTAQECPFDVTISTAAGVTNAVVDSPADSLAQPRPGAIEVLTQTSTAADGVMFDTMPGAVIEIDAKLNASSPSDIFFFVQGGVVNGGYTGAFSNPLMMVPSAP